MDGFAMGMGGGGIRGPFGGAEPFGVAGGMDPALLPEALTGLPGPTGPGGGHVSIETLVFLVASMRLDSIDDDIGARIADMKSRIGAKKAYQQRIDELRRLTAGKDADEKVSITEDLSARRSYFVDPQTGEVCSRDRGSFDQGKKGTVTVDSINKDIERLQGELDSLNADSELSMMRLNQSLSARQQTVTLFSSMLSNFHSTAMAAINNIPK